MQNQEGQMNEDLRIGRTRGRGKKTAKDDVFKDIRPVGTFKTVGEMVYSTLKKAILNGDLKPEQRLIEQTVSRAMNTSRIPVREAIKKLEQDGFVERLPVRGFVVKRVSREEVEETFGIRAALESYAAYMATAHITDIFISSLKDNIRESNKALNEGEIEKLTELNAQFHEMLYKAAGSKKLYKLINTFRDYIARYRKPLFSTKSGGLASLKDHERMVDAMQKGDREKVEKIIKKHILRGRNYIIKEMDSGKPR
jgi:DNA-binding GntR family transcriptional regulator